MKEYKLSFKYWNNSLTNGELQSGEKAEYFDGDKEVYDMLITLEEGIRLFSKPICSASEPERKKMLEALQREYQKLGAKHNLIDVKQKL